MVLSEILTAERVAVASEAEGEVRDAASALQRLAELLASGHGTVEADAIFGVLQEREKIQSTGVGGGVAVPHGFVTELDRQVGAVLVCPQPVSFDAIDGEPVSIFFALVGPRGAPAQHIKVLAKVSRLLRQESFRARLVDAAAGRDAYDMLISHERGPA